MRFYASIAVGLFMISSIGYGAMECSTLLLPEDAANARSRVTIAATFVDVLSMNMAAHTQESGNANFFESLLTLAEHTPGSPGDALFNRLRGHVSGRLGTQDGRNEARKVVLALHRSGRQEASHGILDALITACEKAPEEKGRASNSNSNDAALSTFATQILGDLATLGRNDLGPRILTLIATHYEHARLDLIDATLEHFQRRTGVKFTKEAREELGRRLTPVLQRHYVNSDEILAILRELSQRGTIVSGNEERQKAFEKALNNTGQLLSLEEFITKSWMGFSVVAKDIALAAGNEAMPRQARATAQALVKHMVSGVFEAARRRFFVAVMEVRHQRDRNASYDPHADPAQTLEALVVPGEGGDPRPQIIDGILRDFALNVLKTPDYGAATLDFILDGPWGINGFSWLMYLSETAGKVLTKEQALHFFRRWDERLAGVLPLLAAAGYVNRFDHLVNDSARRTYPHDNSGLGEPPFPQDLHGNSVYTEHRLAQAKLLMAHGNDPQMAALARSLMRGLSHEAGRVHFYDEFRPVLNTLFGEDEGGHIYSSAHYSPLVDSAWHYAQMATVDPAQRARWARKAYDLLITHPDVATGADLERYGNQYLERAISAFMVTIQALLDSGLAEEAHQLSQLFARKLTEFEDATVAKYQAEREKTAREQGENIASLMEDMSGHLTQSFRFYRQHMDIVFAAQLSLVRGQPVDDLIAAVVQDVGSRRNRFQVRSIAMAAKTLLVRPRYQAQGYRLLELVCDKLQLLRGNRDDFAKNAHYFFSVVDQSSLSPSEKDALILRLVQMSEPEKGSDWYQLSTSIDKFLKIADRIQDNEGTYPRSTSEVLRILADLSKHLTFDSSDFSAKAKLMAAAGLFNRIVRSHSYVLDDRYAASILALSQDASHLRRVRALFPAFLDRHRRAVPLTMTGALDTAPIRAELYDRQDTYDEIERQLAALPASSIVTPAFQHLLGVIGEMLGHEVAELRNALIVQNRTTGPSRKDAVPRPSSEALSSTRGARILIDLLGGLLGNKLSRPGARITAAEQLILETLISSAGEEEALDKRALIQSLFLRENMPLRALEILLYGLERAHVVTAFVADQYRTRVRQAPVAEKQWFFSVLRQLLTGTDTVTRTNDSMLAFFLLPDPLRETYWNTFLAWSATGYFENSNTPPPALQGFDRRSLMLAALYTYRTQLNYFNNLDSVPRVLERRIRMLYVENRYLPSAPPGLRYRVTVDQIQTRMRELDLDLTLSPEQRVQIETLFMMHRIQQDTLTNIQTLMTPPIWGFLNDGELLSRVPALGSVPERIRSQLDAYATGKVVDSTDQDQMTLLSQMFGPPILPTLNDEGTRTQLSQTLGDVIRDLEEKMAFVERKRDESLPKAFQALPEMVRFALSAYFKRLPFGERDAILKEFNGDGASAGLSGPAALRRFFELTATEKIGQFLSTRSDLVPEDYRRELQRFQENAAPSSFDEVRRTIEAELGRPLAELFSRFDEHPLNVGTIGEVYRAWLPDGTAVVVKVITPSRRQAMRVMLQRLREVAQDIQRESRRFDLHFDAEALSQEFRRTLESELDFRNEIVNADAMVPTLTEGFSIPPFHRPLCSRSVLVQAYANGVNPLNVSSVDIRRSVMTRMKQLLTDQILNHGLFHEDLHPGNFRVIESSGAVQLLDFGRVGRLTATERQTLMPLLLALSLKQGEQVVSLLDSVKTSQRSYDRALLTERVSAILTQSATGTDGDTISRIFFEAGSLGLAIPSGYIQLLKGFMTLEGTARFMGTALVQAQ